MLGPVLVSIHNVTYYQRLLSRAREAILADRFDTFHQEQMAGWSSPADSAALGQDEQVIGEGLL